MTPLRIRLRLSVAFFFTIMFAFGQQASQQQNVLRIENSGRYNILKASLALHESEESVFWPLYEQYEVQLSALKESTYQSLRELTLNKNEVLSLMALQNLFKAQHKEIGLKKEYFDKIVESTNGTIALQFLQGEALFDLLMKSKLYRGMNWQAPAWAPSIAKDEKAKAVIMKFTLGISGADALRFDELHEDFEYEYSRVVGHEFHFFEQYLDDAGEWTPGQCKKYGTAFIAMQLSEVKVKERFMEQFNKAFGQSFAARYIALQEYFINMSKLKVWSDYVTTTADDTQR
jgi:hypothetical protein